MGVRTACLRRRPCAALRGCAVAAALLLLAACGGGASDAPDTTVTPAATRTRAAEPSPSPRATVTREALPSGEPLVRAIGEPVEVHAGPDSGSPVVGFLTVGEAFSVTGRLLHANVGGWVAVAGAGWVRLNVMLETNFEYRDLPELTDFEAGLPVLGHPPDVRTSVVVVDAMIDAVLAHDAASIIERLNRRQVACEPPGPGFFLVECPEGVAVGTEFTVTRGLIPGCEGGYVMLSSVTPERLEWWFGQPGDEPLALYAVTAIAETKTYGLVFTRHDGAGRFIWISAGSGQVTAMNRGCGWTPAPARARPGTPMLLGPLEPDGLLPPPPPQLVAPFDAPIAGVTTDRLKLRVGPGLSHDVVMQVNTGDIVDVLGRSTDGEWIALRDGWVFYDPDWLALSVGIETLEVVE